MSEVAQDLYGKAMQEIADDGYGYQSTSSFTLELNGPFQRMRVRQEDDTSSSSEMPKRQLRFVSPWRKHSAYVLRHPDFRRESPIEVSNLKLILSWQEREVYEHEKHTMLTECQRKFDPHYLHPPHVTWL